MINHEMSSERNMGWLLEMGRLDILFADGSRPRPVLFSVMNLKTKFLSALECIGENQTVAIETLERLVVRYPKPALIEIDGDLAFEEAEIKRWAREHQIPVRFRPCKSTRPHDKQRSQRHR